MGVSFAVASLAVLLLAILVGTPPRVAFPPSTREPSAQPVTLLGAARTTAALYRVETANPKVIFYWASSTAWPLASHGPTR